MYSLSVITIIFQVNPSDLSNDADPKFLAEFYKNLKILSQDLYKKSVVASTSAPSAFGSPGGKPGAGPAKLGKFKGTPSFGVKDKDIHASMAAAAAAEEVAAGGTLPPSTDFTAESLHERMRLYAQVGGIPMDYLDRYQAGRGRAGTSNTGISEEEWVPI